MSKKLHWFPFYYLDWLSDSEVAMMTYSEKGLFIDMLSRCFNEDGLPADEKKLLRLFKCDADDLQECVKMFYKNGEKLFNKKLDSIKKDQKKISTGRSKAGKASAEARKAKRLTEGTNDEQVLNPVATNLQQNPTNTTQQNTVQQNTDLKDSLSDDKSSDSAKWLEKANPVYLKDCENFYNILMEKGKITKSQNWKTKTWHDGFRLLIESDGVDYHKEFKPVMNFYISNIGKQFCPEAYSPVTVRTKWVKLRDYMKKITPRNSNSNLSARP